MESRWLGVEVEGLGLRALSSVGFIWHCYCYADSGWGGGDLHSHSLWKPDLFDPGFGVPCHKNLREPKRIVVLLSQTLYKWVSNGTVLLT